MPATTAGKMGISALILSAGPVVKFVLILLFLLSVGCWGIIVFKYLRLKRATTESLAFLDIFWGKKRLDEVSLAAKDYEKSPTAKVFRAGYMEIMKFLREKQEEKGGLSARRIDMVERALRRTENAETAALEQHLNFLATTGSAAPFIGLFGTVWGIMNSFQRIGEMGTANLAVVAPGVSEALIATAIGLAAAIPAVVFYNIFVAKIRKLSQETESMILEFLNVTERILEKR